MKILENITSFKAFLSKHDLKNKLYWFIMELITSLFFYNKKKNRYEYLDKNTNRLSVINRCIANFQYQNCKYLEIGVYKNEVFNGIALPQPNKFGCDLFANTDFKMRSDIFFEMNKKKLLFDVIFIDGLHEYNQCQRDVINSVNILKKNGVIIIHDLLPRSPLEENPKRKQLSWTGDVWKVGYELSLSSNCEFIICNADYGIGVLIPRQNFLYKKIEILKNLRFDDFYNTYYNKLPIANTEQVFAFIESKLTKI